MKMGACCAGLVAVFLTLIVADEVGGQADFEEDVIGTAAGDLVITFIGHGTLTFRFEGMWIHVDPVGREADYAGMPEADLILVTHAHGDHLDPEAIEAVRTERTEVIYSRSCAGRVDGAVVLENGESRAVAGMGIEAVPAYNIVHKRSNGQPYHAKGEGNGYVIGFGDLRVYMAGDTENTPEMKGLQEIDVAFLPMNLPYTMTPEMVADAARAFRPRILYPYHYGPTDPGQLRELLAGVEGIEVRVRDMR